MALGEVGADAHALLTHHPDHMPGHVVMSRGLAGAQRIERSREGYALDSLDVIVDSRLGPAPKERREHRHPHEPSVICTAPTVRLALWSLPNGFSQRPELQRLGCYRR